VDRSLIAAKRLGNNLDKGGSCPSYQHFDLAVEILAPRIRQLQSAGIRDIRQLAQGLNDEGLGPRPSWLEFQCNQLQIAQE